MYPLLLGEDVDRRLNWPLGRSERLARRGKLPHAVLPDGAIRFEWPSIESLLQWTRFPQVACQTVTVDDRSVVTSTPLEVRRGRH